jgi:Glycosyltransferase family 87
MGELPSGPAAEVPSADRTQEERVGPRERPAPSGGARRDPPDPRLVELVLAGAPLLAATLARRSPLPLTVDAGFLAVYALVLVYLPRQLDARLACFVVAAGLLAVVPAASFMRATWRGQVDSVHDGGVLLTDAGVRALLRGDDPYTASYAAALAAKPIKVQGRDYLNPATEHYVYWPGSLAVQVPFQAPLLALGWRVDARFAYLAGYLLLCLVLARWNLRARGHLLVAAAVCLNPGLLISLWWGTNDVLALAALAGFALALAARRPVAAGLLLGAGVAVKQTLLLALALFVVWLWAEARQGRMPWRGAWRAAGAGLAIPLATAAPFLLWHPGAFLDDTFGYTLALGRDTYPIFGFNLPRLLLRLGVLRDPFGPAPLWATALPAGAAMLAAAWWLWRRPATRTLLVSAAVALAASLCFHRWTTEYYYLVVPVSLALLAQVPPRAGAAPAAATP